MPSPPVSLQKSVTTPEDLLCGAVAGGTARMVVSPLDVLKIRFQVQSDMSSRFQYTSMTSATRTIFLREGIAGFWKGNVAALLMVMPYASIQFATFYQLKELGVAAGTREPYRSLELGAFAGASATVAVYPLDLLRTRFAVQTEPRLYTSVAHAFGLIYRKDGVRGLYAGLQPTLMEIVPQVSVQFAVYEAARKRLLQQGESDCLSPIQNLTIGAVSGLAGKFGTFPLDVCKKKLQIASDNPGRSYTGVWDVLRQVYRREGVRGLFRGLAPSLLKSVPNSAVTFLIYQEARDMFARRHAREREASGVT